MRAWCRVFSGVVLLGAVGVAACDTIVSKRVPPIETAGAGSAGSGGWTSGGAGGTEAEGGTGSQVSDPEADAAALAAFHARRIEAECARDQRCQMTWFDETSCAAFQRWELTVAEYQDGLDYAAENAAKFALGSEAAQDACLQALASAACEDVRTPHLACRTAVVPLDPLALGSPCAVDTHGVRLDQCAVGLRCDASNGGIGRCAAEAPSQWLESCTVDGECDAGLVCESASRCREPSELGGEGDECQSASCGRGLVCSGREGTLTCFALQDLGEPCWLDGQYYECRQGLVCTEGSGCERGAQEGETCARDPQRLGCGLGLWCEFEAPDSPLGICTSSPSPVPGPCAYDWEMIANCPFGTVMDMAGTGAEADPPAYCDCLAR